MSRLCLVRRIIATLCCMLLLGAPAALINAASLDPQTQSAVDAARTELRADREKLLSENLKLTQEESDRFWPLYREFAAKRSELADQRLETIVDYAAAYPNVSDATAKDLVARALKHDKQMSGLKQSYARKFGKVLPAAKQMQLLQIEERIDLLVEVALKRAIPVVEP